MRHTAYYDWGAMCRMSLFIEVGLTPGFMSGLNFGPILFREECLFRKEIRFEDKVIIDLELTKAKKDYSRWTIQHTILKNDAILCARITVDGAWLHTVKRKLFVLPGEAADMFAKFPRSDGFSWID